MNHNGFASNEFLHCGNRVSSADSLPGIKLHSDDLLFNRLLALIDRQAQIEKLMSVPTRNGPQNATAKVKASRVKAAAKTPSLEERIQKADKLKSLTLKRELAIKTLHHGRTFSFASYVMRRLYTLFGSNIQEKYMQGDSVIHLIAMHVRFKIKD